MCDAFGAVDGRIDAFGAVDARIDVLGVQRLGGGCHLAFTMVLLLGLYHGSEEAAVAWRRLSMTVHGAVNCTTARRRLSLGLYDSSVADGWEERGGCCRLEEAVDDGSRFVGGCRLYDGSEEAVAWLVQQFCCRRFGGATVHSKVLVDISPW
jgi:hypothetical protein